MTASLQGLISAFVIPTSDAHFLCIVMYLIDTVVISELRKRQPAPSVVHWISQRVESELFLSVLTIGEIQRGMVKKRQNDPVFAEVLSAWLDALLRNYGDRILPVSTVIARLWGGIELAGKA